MVLNLIIQSSIPKIGPGMGMDVAGSQDLTVQEIHVALVVELGQAALNEMICVASTHGMSLKEVPDGGTGVEIARGSTNDHGWQVWKASWPSVTTVDDGVEFDTGLGFAAGIACVLHPCAIVRASFQIFGDGSAN